MLGLICLHCQIASCGPCLTSLAVEVRQMSVGASCSGPVPLQRGCADRMQAGAFNSCDCLCTPRAGEVSSSETSPALRTHRPSLLPNAHAPNPEGTFMSLFEPN